MLIQSEIPDNMATYRTLIITNRRRVSYGMV